MSQLNMVCLEDLVDADHIYRKFLELWSLDSVMAHLYDVENDSNYKGYGVLRLFKCLLLQFMEDLSDRELERFLKENNAGKWFCEFDLTETSPTHTVFTRARERIGTERLAMIFNELRDQLKAQGYINEVFSFVDASQLMSKAALWKERDNAIKKKYEKLNNEILPKVAHDTQARIGCKGKDKFWYGYKKHVCVDMQDGFINKVAITPANTTDAQGLKHVCPDQGAIFADKAYCVKPATDAATRKGCHLAAIKKNNMKGKNKDKDHWYSKMRAPYERVFSQQNKRVRYCGIKKNQFTAFMESICFNLKRLVVLDSLRMQQGS